MRKLLFVFVGILFTLNIFAGEPVKIVDFQTTEWTIAIEESGIQVFYKKAEVNKKNGEPFSYVIFKVVNTTETSQNVNLTISVTFGSDGDIIAKSAIKEFEIPANDYVVDSSQRGEERLRVPLNYKASYNGIPLQDIVINEITIN